jgi:23S rRNA (uracil1939-C5)-methyltransferase
MTRRRQERIEAVSTVVDLDHEGRGVAHHEGKTVFISDALPGERVRWSRTHVHRNFDEARLLEILEPSADRVAPACPHFGVCGGCVLQHLDPAKQIAFKESQLLESLRRIGHIEPEIKLPPLVADPWHYRRRGRLAVKWVEKKDRCVVGFRERSTTLIADLKSCSVLAEPAAHLIEPLAVMISLMSVRDRLPQIEVSVADHVCAMVFRTLKPLDARDLELLQAFSREHSVQIYLQPGGYETVAPLAADTKPLTYRLAELDVEIEFSPSDFIQVNAALNERMIVQAIELLQVTSADTTLDLFCGLGNFSLPLARRAGHVVGVEGEAGLIDRARKNAVRNNITNAEFVVANLTEEHAGAPWARRKFSRVLLDPPRAGAREALPLIAASGARRVVYISCHPGSLARDSGILTQDYGYTLKAAGVMDMFPHTAHVESIAVFERS